MLSDQKTWIPLAAANIFKIISRNKNKSETVLDYTHIPFSSQ